jgi:hypothetical protein
MAERIGIMIPPDVLGMLFRIGAVVTGEYGFAARLVQDGVPHGHELVDCGYNRQEGQFFFIFAPQEDREPGPVVWQAPVYEKEQGHGIDS